jgi:hypothetical protein
VTVSLTIVGSGQCSVFQSLTDLTAKAAESQPVFGGAAIFKTYTAQKWVGFAPFSAKDTAASNPLFASVSVESTSDTSGDQIQLEPVCRLPKVKTGEEDDRGMVALPARLRVVKVDKAVSLQFMV